MKNQQSVSGQFIKWFATIFQERWKVFLISVVVQLMLSTLIHLGIRSPKMLDFLAVPTKITSGITSPLPSDWSVFDVVESKLKQKSNSYQLKREVGFIPEAVAASDYEMANAYIVVDYDSGKILAEKNISQRLSIASLTKIMTAIIALDLAPSDEQFSVSGQAASIPPTKIGVVPNQKMSNNELLHAVMLTSANDGAEVLKEGIDKKYQEEVFIKAMNTKAEFLNLKNTSFTNPQGFDNPDNYSSAEDLAILSHYALENYPQLVEIIKKDYHHIPANRDHKQFDLYNWNGLIGVYPGTYGVKIGNTDQADYTTVVVSEREGKKILVVLLGAPGVLERDMWTAQLLDIGFGKIGVDPVPVTVTDLQLKYSTWKYWD